MSRVFIGVGHGGKDPGAVAKGFLEKELNLAIGLACRDELERHGVEVGMSRTTDEDDNASEVVGECNAFAPDLAVDIHNNAGGGDGAEAYYHHGGGEGEYLAYNILNEIVAIGQNSRGAKTKVNDSGRDYYGFIRQTFAPAVIVECAFLDSQDVETVDTAQEQKTMGVAIAKGILYTLGIAWQAPVVESNTPENESNGVMLPTLQKGDKSATVGALQALLIGYGYPCGNTGADQDFGPATDRALRAYQGDYALVVDGICGKNTWASLLGLA